MEKSRFSEIDMKCFICWGWFNGSVLWNRRSLSVTIHQQFVSNSMHTSKTNFFHQIQAKFWLLTALLIESYCKRPQRLVLYPFWSNIWSEYKSVVTLVWRHWKGDRVPRLVIFHKPIEDIKRDTSIENDFILYSLLSVWSSWNFLLCELFLFLCHSIKQRKGFKLR